MTKDEALKLALEALSDLSAWNDGEVGGHMDEPYSAEVARRTITAIKEALAQPEQEPVAWEQFYPDIGKPQIEFAPVKMVAYNCTCGRTIKFESEHGVVAPQRTWVSLTDEEINLLAKAYSTMEGELNAPAFARAILRKAQNK